MHDWLIHSLLPVVYWYHQMTKTQNSRNRTDYLQAWQAALARLNAHPLTQALDDSEIQHWLNWADVMCRQFHRSSSAVEGRNGSLSQRYHTGRGMSKRRLAAATVIHNYGIKRYDGSTAAERLFKIDFPDLVFWLLTQMDEPPLPHRARPRVLANPLKLVAVLA